MFTYSVFVSYQLQKFLLKSISAVVTSLCFMGLPFLKKSLHHCFVELFMFSSICHKNKKNVHHSSLLFFSKMYQFFFFFCTLDKKALLSCFFLIIMESSKNMTESKCDLYFQQWLLLRVKDISSLTLRL